jgi:hypothetical protein
MKRNQLLALVVFLSLGPGVQSLMAQTATVPSMTRPASGPAAAPAAAPAGSQPAKPPISAQEIEQLVAPIALYPDSLISQILMASTYPLEIVQADRFAKANPKLTGDALTAQLEKQEWDASVKSLVNFPTVLSMMGEKLDSTIKLGDAFLADQKGVLDAVQRLRGKAQAQGNLETTKEQKVIVEQVPQSTTQVIRIEPTNPEVIYVPTYNPTVVYGSWPYPAYPPYAWYPPGYVASGVIGFGLGFAAGAAWGYAWGNCNWGGGDIDVDIDRNTNINRNIDRSKYQNKINNLQNNRGTGAAGAGNRKGTFQHDPAHRQGVAYRDQKTASQFGGASNQATQARDAFRGRAEAGRADIGRGDAGQFRGPNAPSPSVGNRPIAGTGALGGAGNLGGGAANRPSTGGGIGSGAANRPSTGNLGGAGANRPSTPAARPSTGSGLSGVGGGARPTQSSVQRGTASRASSPAPRAAARPSTGAARAGGGARAGGRR